MMLFLFCCVLCIVVVGTAVHPRWLIPSIAVLGIILLPPTLFGERYATVGSILVTVAGILSALTESRTNRRAIGWFVLLVILGYTWLAIHNATVPGSEPTLLAGLVTTVLPVIAFYFIASNRHLLRQVTGGLVAMITLFALGAAVSFGLGALVGFDAIMIENVPLGYSARGIGLLLPGGFTYGPTADANLPRMLGLGREPGMGAIFFVWAFFAVPSEWKRRYLIRIVIVLALLTTRSTAGIGLFAAAVIAWVLFGRERIRILPSIAGCVVGAALLYITIFDQSFGIVAKSETVSFYDRSEATARGWEALRHNFWSATTDLPLSNVTLIASVSAHGGPWLIIMVTLLLLCVVRLGRTNPYTYSTVFIFATLMTSQPLLHSAGVFILLMASVSVESPDLLRQSQSSIATITPVSTTSTAKP